MGAFTSIGKKSWQVNVGKALSLLGATLGALLFCLPSFAQLNLGRIFGSVTDASGGAVVGATVTVIDVARGISRPLVADNAGEYSAPSLTPGMYTVRAEAKGFKLEEHTGISVGVGQDVRVDLTLQPGEQTQTITVTGDLPQVQTTNAQLTGTIENTSVEDLPLNGRDYQYMLGQRPGTIMHPNAGTSDYASDGTRFGDVTWMFDGVFDVDIEGGTQSIISAYQLGPDETNILPLDSIQEVDIIQGTAKAEYGDRAGTHVNVGLKSGTNSLHGTAYAFGRDTALNAKNQFLAEPAGLPVLPKAPLGLTQYGASLGGPIKKDKLFFFMNYEGQKYDVGNPLISILPTTASLATGASPNGTPGSSFPDSIYDVLHNPNNTLGAVPSALSLNLAGCQGVVNSVGGVASGNFTAAQITALKGESLATIASGCNAANGLFVNSTSSADDAIDLLSTGGSNNAIAKFDYHPSDKHSINGEIYEGGGKDIAPFQGPIQEYWAEDLITWANVARLVWVWTPNSSIVNEARLGYDQLNMPSLIYECDKTNYPNLTAPNYQQQFGYITLPCDANSISGGFPQLTVNGFTALGGFGVTQDSNQKYITFTDAVSYTHGKHLFKVGTEIRPMYNEGSTPQDGRGVLGFGGVNALGPTATNNALDDFVAGMPSNNNLVLIGNQTEYTHFFTYAAFVQDDWRITPRITLNLGIRWEYTTPLVSANNSFANVDLASPTGLIQQTGGHGIYSTKADNFAPRFGVAWDVTGSGKTVVHAGLTLMDTTTENINQLTYVGSALLNGIPTGFTYYNANGSSGLETIYNRNLVALPGTAGIGEGVLNLASNAVPWLVNTPPLSGTGKALACGNGLAPVNPVAGAPALNPSPCSVNGQALNTTWPYFITRTVGIQRAITNNLFLTVNYVGTHGTGWWYNKNMNVPTPGSVAGEQQRRPLYNTLPDFSNVYVSTGGEMSNYNGLQVTVAQRLSHGLNFTAGYTYSYNRDDSGTPSQGNNPLPDYGFSSEDVRNLLTFTMTYNIPGRKSPGQLLEGWQINNSVNFTGGFPVNAVDSVDDISGTQVDADRWTMVGNASDIDREFGGAGPVPCYGFAGGVVNGVTLGPGSFAAAHNCVAALPAACVSAAANEPNGPGGTTGTQMLDKLGCYMVGSTVIVPPAQGTYGNIPRDDFRDHSYHNWDFSATKTWEFRERYSAQFKAEFFNILNLPGWAPPSANLAAPSSFGESTKTNDSGNAVIGNGPRKIQFGLKIIF